MLQTRGEDTMVEFQDHSDTYTKEPAGSRCNLEKKQASIITVQCLLEEDNYDVLFGDMVKSVYSRLV